MVQLHTVSEFSKSQLHRNQSITQKMQINTGASTLKQLKTCHDRADNVIKYKTYKTTLSMHLF